MQISNMTKIEYNTNLQYFNKLCDLIEASGQFSTIFRGSNVYLTINYGVKAIYKLNHAQPKYLHILSNDEQKPSFPIQANQLSYFNPALVNVNYLQVYVSPFYVVNGNPIGNYQSAGITGNVTTLGQINASVMDTFGNSEAYFFDNSNSVHIVSFFKQKLYSQMMIKFNSTTGFLLCTSTACGCTTVTAGQPKDRARKGPLLKDSRYFYPYSGNAFYFQTTLIDADNLYTYSVLNNDVHYNNAFGLLFSNASISKMTNYTTNLAVTAPIVMGNMRYYFDDINYIQLKNLKHREIFNVGEQEFISFPIDTVEDPNNLGYVLGYVFRTK